MEVLSPAADVPYDVASAEVFCYAPPDCLLPSSTPNLVRVTLTVEPQTQGARSVVLSTDVHLRNQ